MKVERFQALASSYRLSILSMLRQGPMSAGDIARQFDISQPSVSRHLEVLRHAKMVTTERKGTLVIYSLNLSALQEVAVDVTDLIIGTVAPKDISDKMIEE